MSMSKAFQPDARKILHLPGFRFGIAGLLILLALPVLLFEAYCWGLWGRKSLLMQYFIQCKCPPASEQSRYPEQVEIVISACRNADVNVLPGGRYLYSYEEKSGGISNSLFDLQTGEEEKISVNVTDFLTDVLWLIRIGPKEFLLDRSTGKQDPIQIFKFWGDDAYVNGEPNLALLKSALHEAETIYITSSYNYKAVVLMPDFRNHPERSFTFNTIDMPGSSLERFLLENQIAYQQAQPSSPKELLSADGKFIARSDGIYLASTGERIVPGYTSSSHDRAYSGQYFSVRGWSYDGRGVIYSKFLNPCLLEGSSILTDGPFCMVEVPEPVILLKVPERYLELQTP